MTEAPDSNAQGAMDRPDAGGSGAAWAAMVTGDDPRAAVHQHLSFLARAPECERLLDALMANFVRAGVGVGAGDGVLELVFRYDDDDDEEAAIHLYGPYDGDTGAAPSVAEVARVHNGVVWESLGGGEFGFAGFREGVFGGAGGWEPKVLTEAARANEAFLAELSAAELTYRDVKGAFDYGQNWLIWHPARRNALGEPALFFVSHENCVAVEVAGAADLTFGQILLRLMVQTILGHDLFPEIYS